MPLKVWWLQTAVHMVKYVEDYHFNDFDSFRLFYNFALQFRMKVLFAELLRTAAIDCLSMRTTSQATSHAHAPPHLPSPFLTSCL